MMSVLHFSVSVAVLVFSVILIIFLPLSSSGSEKQEIYVSAEYEVMSVVI